jgi:glutamyl-tRNA synthetase
MINGTDGKKLSKRHGAVSVLEYRDKGYLPEALLNYLARLGWAYGDQEIFSLDELTAAFDFDGLNKSSASFDWDKLTWLNQHYIQHAPTARLRALAAPFFKSANLDVSDGPDFGAAIDAQRTRAKTLVDIAEQSRMFFGDLIADADAAKKHLRPVIAPALAVLREKFAALAAWDGSELQQIVEETAQQFDFKMGKIAQPLRVAVTGSAASPSIDITLELVGKARCLARLDEAIRYIEERGAA